MVVPVIGQINIEHPRRSVLFILAVLVFIAGMHVVIHVVDQGPPRNDQATLVQLQSQFLQSAWEPSLFSAYWQGGEDHTLYVGLDTDDRRLALAACSDLWGVVTDWPSTSPSGVTYRYEYSDASLFISDRSGNLLVTSFRGSRASCSWRLD
jgi:hypothetical protein